MDQLTGVDAEPGGRLPSNRPDELAALYKLTDRLYRARSLSDVYDAGLDAILETLSCARASVLLFDNAGVMRFVAWRNLSQGYRGALEGHTPWRPGERDPQPIFVSDIDEADESDEVKAAIHGEGIRALGFIPLVVRGGVIGKFMTYYESARAFPAHEVDLAVTIARQLGFSLERHRAEEELRESEERFRLMSEHAPVMIWMSDPQGGCLHLNHMLRTFWGVSEDDITTFDWRTMMHPDDAPKIASSIYEALQNRQRVTILGRYMNTSGQIRVLRTDARPRFSAQGEFLGMIGVNVDVTEQEAAASALRESEERFRLAVEAAPSGMIMSDSAGTVVLVNAQAESLFGYGRAELVGKTVELLVPPRLRDCHPFNRETCLQQPGARPMGAGRNLFVLRKDGSEIPVEIGLSSLTTAEGVMTLAAVVDISERKAADAQREVLLAELNHRVKNTLAVVQGIAHQTLRQSSVPAGVLQAFEGRLVALACAHNLLTQAQWESASLDQLLADTLLAAAGDLGRIGREGPDVLLSPRQALALAMAFHELGTNAVKYGALSNDSGRIEIGWSRSKESPSLELTWQEVDGPPVSRPASRGFGSVLLERTLAHDLDGKVDLQFRPGGLVCSIAASLSVGR